MAKRKSTKVQTTIYKTYTRTPIKTQVLPNKAWRYQRGNQKYKHKKDRQDNDQMKKDKHWSTKYDTEN